MCFPVFCEHLQLQLLRKTESLLIGQLSEGAIRSTGGGAAGAIMMRMMKAEQALKTR